MRLKMFTVYSLVCFQICLLIELLIKRGKELDASIEKVQSKFVAQRKIQVPMVVDIQTRFTLPQQIVVDNFNKPRLCSNLAPKKSFKSNISTFSSYSSLPPSISSSLPLSVSTISLPGSLGNYESILPPLQSNTKFTSTSSTTTSSFSSPLYTYSSSSSPANSSPEYPSISMSPSLATLNYLNSSQPSTPLSHKRRHEKHHQQQAKSKCHSIKVHRSKMVFIQPLCSKHYLHITGKTVRATKTSHLIDSVFNITAMAIRGKRSGTLVRFQDLRSGKYICYNKKGKIVAKENGQWDLSCIFREHHSNGLSFKYQSFYNNNWHLGFDPKGRPIRGTVNRHERSKSGSRRLKISKHCYEFSKINIKQSN
ncbi:uncharacterized protein LOC107360612 isoform X1 [Tetranychus urticae]|uniref:uncharacterized protein LOC107360612 isoform X1 n=1 Tax=Tetranychus urticae TaxID=32264 RepID=UPI000D653EB0|nr:uncharacterized protein LOC107360612 isoform X1 [Tetranychus urticae]